MTSRTAEAFRSELRAWLRDNVPAEPLPDEFDERFASMRAWQSRLYEAGFAAPSYPAAYGGRDGGAVEESILSEELARAGAPPTLPLGHLGRPFLSHGSEEQRIRYLPPLLAALDIWCQGFSEPSAGSDLANLRARARREGEKYVLSGQKTWTSYGAFADYALVLARTGPVDERHRAISAFIVPLDAPGVTVRPLVLANGDQEFAELFLDEVEVPESDRLGDEGDGWAIAMATIEHERGAVDTGYQVKFEGFVEELAAMLASRDGVTSAELEALGSAAVATEVMALHCRRRSAARKEGHTPGPAASIDKELMTHVEQRLMDVALQLVPGLGGSAWDHWFDRYLYGRAASIYGGTSQIQKNLLAQRVLGLPRK